MSEKKTLVRKYKYEEVLKTVLLMTAVSLILRLFLFTAEEKLAQQGIAEEVLRFHILANSDSTEDQRIKYLVRNEVLEWMEEAMEHDIMIQDATNQDVTARENVAQASMRKYQEDGIGQISSRDEVLDFLESHLDALEKMADQVLEREGASYRASAAVENFWFPDRAYGECTFPAGYYKALRLKLGEAEGRNWWCVLYPGQCFRDCLHSVAGEDQMTQLEKILTAEEYDALLQKPSGWRIAFRWF